MSTPVLGCGLAPLGSSPCGWGSPATSDAPGVPAIGTGRAINPTTKDYFVDTVTPGATGSLARMGTVQQLVYLALATVRGSAAVDMGRDALPRMITDRTREELLSSVAKALAALIAAGQVELVSVTQVSLIPGRIREEIRWRDLTTNTEHLSTL